MNRTQLRRYDRNMVLGISLELPWPGGLECAERGAWIASVPRDRNDTVNTTPGLHLDHFTEEGLVASHVVAPDLIFSSGVMPIVRGRHIILQIGRVIFRLNDAFEIEQEVILPETRSSSSNVALDDDGNLMWIAQEPEIGPAFSWKLYTAAPGEEFMPQTTVARVFHGRASQIRVTPSGDIVVAAAGRLDERLDDPKRLGQLAGFVLSFNRRGEILWLREFWSSSVLSSQHVEIGPDGRIWWSASFKEWVETDQHIVYGHVLDADPASAAWEHRLLIQLETDGHVSRMLPLGRAGLYFAALPTSATTATLVARASNTDGRVGEVAMVVDFPDEPLLDKPIPPTETLRRAAPRTVRGAPLTSVMQADDGRTYLYALDDANLQFVEYPTGRASPPFALSFTDESPRQIRRFELFEDRLFWFEGGDVLGAPRPILRIFQDAGGQWELAQELAFDPLTFWSTNYGAMLVSDDWLFLGGFDRVAAFPATEYGFGEPVVLTTGWGVGQVLARHGDYLYVSDLSFTRERDGAGRVLEFRLDGDRWEQSAVLVDSNPLPYAPASVDIYPPSGKGFGAWIQPHDDALLISNRQGETYWFTRDGEQWREQDIIRLDGAPLRIGATLAAARATEMRGSTPRSGAIHLFQRSGESREWQPVHRIVPARRWSAGFGTSMALYENTLLVGAPDYIDEEGTRGAVFEVDLTACMR